MHTTAAPAASAANLLAHDESGDGMHECCHVYGDADWPGRVLILGPVNPVWHGGDFCAPLLDFFASRKERVFVLDTIPFIGDGDAEASIRKLAKFIKRHLPHIEVIAGYALGGTVALKLARHVPERTKILCLSGPGFIDESLRGKLQALLDHLGEADLEGCLSTLSAMVAPRGKVPGAQHRDRISERDAQLGCRRMRKGFGFLLNLDARLGLDDYPSSIMCMLGEHSQLATTDNLAIRVTPSDASRKLALVPDAGMRILLDNQAYTLSTIDEWLENGK
jgi:pimeloyl-ACP methyl ester carboxylesterase